MARFHAIAVMVALLSTPMALLVRGVVCDPAECDCVTCAPGKVQAEAMQETVRCSETRDAMCAAIGPSGPSRTGLRLYRARRTDDAFGASSRSGLASPANLSALDRPQFPDLFPPRSSLREASSHSAALKFNLEWRLPMRKYVVILLAVVLLAFAPLARATIFGSVRGIVHDPQHRPIADADVKLQSATSDFSLTAQTDQNGEFTFNPVAVGDYTVTVSHSGFAKRSAERHRRFGLVADSPFRARNRARKSDYNRHGDCGSGQRRFVHSHHAR